MNPVVEAWVVIEKLGALVATPGISDDVKTLANEEIAKLALKIAYTAAKVPVNPDTKDSFKRISSKYN